MVCRTKNIKIIYGLCLGLAGYVFSEKEAILISSYARAKIHYYDVKKNGGNDRAKLEKYKIRMKHAAHKIRQNPCFAG